MVSCRLMLTQNHLTLIVVRFACVCSVDGEAYPQGQGKTKKEAKTNAAKEAFQSILGLGEIDDDGGK